MEYTEKEKAEKLKRPIIKRLENIGDVETLITLLKNLTWTKIKNFLDQDLQADADQREDNSQEALDEKAKILALKEEKDTF